MEINSGSKNPKPRTMRVGSGKKKGKTRKTNAGSLFFPTLRRKRVFIYTELYTKASSLLSSSNLTFVLGGNPVSHATKSCISLPKKVAPFGNFYSFKK